MAFLSEAYSRLNVFGKEISLFCTDEARLESIERDIDTVIGKGALIFSIIFVNIAVVCIMLGSLVKKLVLRVFFRSLLLIVPITCFAIGEQVLLKAEVVKCVDEESAISLKHLRGDRKQLATAHESALERLESEDGDPDAATPHLVTANELCQRDGRTV